MNNLADFDFELPKDRVAQTPVRPRDAARLLCVRPPARPLHSSADQAFAAARGLSEPRRDDGSALSSPPNTFRAASAFQTGAAPSPSGVRDGLEDCLVRDLPDLLRPGDMLVANDTRVIPARLVARRGDARIDITLNQPQPDGSWHALARNARRLRVGDSLLFDNDMTAVVTARDAGGGVTLLFNYRGDTFVDALRHTGALALPPYIYRPRGPDLDDSNDYQTVFASNDGAVAAPTAGLHFTPSLLGALDARGIRRATVTLHVGAGTFLPVRSDDISRHKMHAERGTISAVTARAINDVRAAGGRIVAVGTTSLRLMESAMADDGMIMPFDGETSLFILPGYRFRAVDLLMTNFHLPRSTLFMLVCAFAGTEAMRSAYVHAIASGYRFYSYGDASLLWRHDQ